MKQSKSGILSKSYVMGKLERAWQDQVFSVPLVPSRDSSVPVLKGCGVLPVSMGKRVWWSSDEGLSFKGATWRRSIHSKSQPGRSRGDVVGKDKFIGNVLIGLRPGDLPKILEDDVRIVLVFDIPEGKEVSYPGHTIVVNFGDFLLDSRMRWMLTALKEGRVTRE